MLKNQVEQIAPCGGNTRGSTNLVQLNLSDDAYLKDERARFSINSFSFRCRCIQLVLTRKEV